MKRVCRQGSVVILCGALTLGAGACRKAGPAAGAGGAPGGRPPVVVQCAPAVQQDAPVVVTAFGTLEERVNVDVVPQVSGVLTRTLVADGAVVTNGQPLFAIDDRDYAARVRQAEAAVAAGRANLAQGRATLERNRGLLAKQLIAADQFETLDTRVAALAAQVQADEATLDLARLNLSRCTVTAAVAGVCGKRYVDEGNLVGAGLTRLINIRNCDPVDVECTLPEALLGDVRRALAAGPVSLEVTPRGETNRYSGRLTFVDNAVNSASGTILVRGEVPNPARRLWARQFVDVRILAATVAGAILVPECAVQFGKRGPFLYVAGADHKAEMRPVRTGLRVDNQLQIVEGVAAGERVVVLGQLMLYPGATVMDAPPAGGPGPQAPAGATAGAAAGAADDKQQAPASAAAGAADDKRQQ